MKHEDALQQVPFLKTLPVEALAAVAGAGHERRLQKGEMLFAENDRCIGLIVVLTGAIKIYKIDNRGRELTLALEKPGESVAELPLFDGGNYPASAEAAEDSTTVLVVPRDQFRRAMFQHPEIAEQALRALAIRMRKLVQMVEAQTLHTVRMRLAVYLLRAARERREFRLEESNDAIASQIGTVRDVVSRTLSAFKDTGLIALSGRAVTLLDRDALRRIAEAEILP